jgi:hypothetical protein
MVSNQWTRLGWGVNGIPTDQERERNLQAARDIIYGSIHEKCECVYTAKSSVFFSGIELTDPGCRACGGSGFVRRNAPQA